METDENSERQRQVSLFRAGDKDLLETIYGKFLHSFIYLYVITCNCQIEDARDAFSKAVEETYIKIISDMDFILTSSLETYIFRVARNKLINIIKSKLRLEKLENNLNDIIADVKSLENIEENNFRKKYVQNMLKILFLTYGKIN